MTTPTSAAASPQKKRRVGRIITIVLAVLIIPLVVGYFVVTSTMFLKRVILPRAGASMNSSITASDAMISPFSQIVFKNFEVKPIGKETLFKADEVRARYSLRDIIGGKITVHEITVLSPIVTIVEAADGSNNLDRATKEGASKQDAKMEKKSGQPPNLNIKNISLKNALVHHTKHLEGGGREVTEISNLNFTLDQLINGQPGKMNVAADIRMDWTPSANMTNAAAGSLRAKLDGDFDYKLTAKVQPESAKGNLRFDVLEATGGLSKFAKLTAQLQLDGAMQNEVFDLRQFQVTLSPTTRAKNQLNITGQLDLSNMNAMKGKLLVQSDSFDVTPFYDLYAAPEKKGAAGTTTPAQPVPETKPNQEPEPIKLPVEQIVAEINIGQLYLREIEIKDWRSMATTEGSRVLLNPFQLSLNGAPVKLDADLDLGVKGYVYNFSASADGIPLEPLANSFLPPEKRGAYQGTVFANAKIKGAGTTGVNLKKTLSGQASLNFTNANIQIVGPKSKKILLPISTVLQIPEIANSPIHWIDARLDFADGKINIPGFVVVSDSYRGTVQGSVPIADVLTNSPLNKIPIGFELKKALAEKARLGSGEVSADGNYTKLPNLISLSGTLGNPKPEFDKKGLAMLTLQTGAGYIGGDAGKVLKSLGGILEGQSTTNTNSTNATTNEQLNIDNVIDLFKKKKK